MNTAQTKLDLTSPMPKKHNPWLYGLLLLTLMATVWISLNGDSLSTEDELQIKPMPNKMRSAATKTQPFQPTMNLASLNQHNHAPVKDGLTAQPLEIVSRSYGPVNQNMFSMQTWAPPVAKSKKQARPVAPPPVAPPIPFSYLGKIEEDGKAEYFVMQQNKLFNLKIGQQVHGQWRLDSEDAQYLNWTFLPLKLPQILPKTTNQKDLALMKNVFAIPEQ